MSKQPTNATTSSKKKQTPQAKCWCYTLNNPSAAIAFNEDTMTYLVYGEEVGESGTPHHQGFVIFKNNKRLNNLKDINGKAHWEMKSPKSTYAEASDYCKKDGKYYEFGTLPVENIKKAQPAGNKANHEKWRAINDKAKEGDLDWIDQQHPKVFNQSYRNLKQMRTDYMKRKEDLPDVCGLWLYGKSGVGKTKLVRTLYPDAYLKKPNNKWFDGYQQEDVVVIDDLDDTHTYMGYELKKLADAYCYLVEVKNSSMYIRPSKCVVTSQYTIREIWSDDQKTCEALERRFKQVEVTKDNRDILSYTYQQPSKEVPTEVKGPIEKAFEKTPPVTPRNIDIIEDDDEAAIYDQLMIEAAETLANNRKRERKETVKDKVQSANKKQAISNTTTFTPLYRRKTASANQYHPDKFKTFEKPLAIPTKSSLKRCNAMIMDKPTTLQSDEVIDYDSDDEIEIVEVKRKPTQKVVDDDLGSVIHLSELYDGENTESESDN